MRKINPFKLSIKNHCQKYFLKNFDKLILAFRNIISQALDTCMFQPNKINLQYAY